MKIMKMSKSRWIGLILCVSIFLAAFGISLAGITTGLQVSRQATLNMTVDAAIVLSGDNIGLWDDAAKTVPVDSLDFVRLQLQPPLKSIDKSQPTFIENRAAVPLEFVEPCHNLEEPPGTVVGHIRARLHDIATGQFLGEACNQQVTLQPGDLVEANITVHLEADLAPGEHTFTVIFGAVGTTGDVAIDPPAGMVSWWPGDGNANDIVATNHGSLSGNATATADGMVGQAFSFDGAGDSVVVGHDPSLNLNHFTLDAWVKPGRFTPGDHQAIITKNVSLRPPSLWLFGDKVQVWTEPDASPAATSATGLTLIEWHHLAATYDGEAVKIYINGDLDVSAPWTFTPAANTSPLLIGAGRDNNQFFFQGLIDEVEIFNRALSAAEIRAIFDAGSAGKRKPEPASIVLDPVADGLVRDTVSGIKDGVPDLAIDDSVIQALDLPNFEDRGIAEFNISALPGTINSARFEFTAHGANGPFPFEVDLFGYSTTANGLVELNDWASGSLLNTFAYSGDQATVSLDVATFLQGRVASGDIHVGFRLEFANPSNIIQDGPFLSIKSIEFPPAPTLTVN